MEEKNCNQGFFPHSMLKILEISVSNYSEINMKFEFKITVSKWFTI